MISCSCFFTCVRVVFRFFFKRMTLYSTTATLLTVKTVLIKRFYSCVYENLSISKVLKTKPLQKKVSIVGWVRSHRKGKDVTFLDINDGSCLQRLQVVLPSLEKPQNLGYQCSVHVEGVVQLSSHPKQEIDLLADKVEVLGACNTDEFPFKARQVQPPELLRQHLHLRARTNSFSSMMRVRSKAKMSIYDYFNKEGFVNVDTPIITSNDCEGGGNVFIVKTSNANSCPPTIDPNFFGKPVFLSVSGQLHLEAMASGLSRVYNMSPAFRAENSLTRRHLSEFWMVESEEVVECGAIGLQTIMQRVEELVKFVLQSVVETHMEELEWHWQQNPGSQEHVRRAINEPFAHMTYTKAMEILVEYKNDFKTKPILGEDFGTEHELFLVEHVGNIPVFVTDWPSSCKPFYMKRLEENSQLVHGVDLLVPQVGELVGGGLREWSQLHLQQQLAQSGLQESLHWYLDLRRLGGVPTGGFGLGFERLLQFLLGVPNIKDTIAFPRWVKHCSG